MSALPGSRNSGLADRQGRTGRELCVLCPLRCSPGLVLILPCTWCEHRALGEAGRELVFPLCPGLLQCQKCPDSSKGKNSAKGNNSVAQESRQTFVLSNSELHSRRYGFAPGFGRLSFLSFASNKDEGLYVIHWITMAIFESLDVAVSVQTRCKFFYPHGIKLKCRTVDPCGRDSWQ